MLGTGHPYAELMTAIAFDTLKFVKRLKEAGFTDQQAEALAVTGAELVEDNLATKRDLKDLERVVTRDTKEIEAALTRDMKELEATLKHDMKGLEAALKHDMKELEAAHARHESTRNRPAE